LEPAAEALQHIEESYPEPWPDAVRKNAVILTQAGLYPGIDFSVIPYVGRPRTAVQNAENAQRYGARGVELSAIAKSFAGKTTLDWGKHGILEASVILTGPADLKFKTADILPGQIGDLEPIDDEQLERLGLEHGTVNPVGSLSPTPLNPVYYLFDQDFIDPTTRNPDRRVYISGGDPGWSIALDIRKLIAAATMVAPLQAVSDICERGPDSDRVFARHDITLISGDSPQVGARYYEVLEEAVRSGLKEAGAYHGDDSMPNLDLLSRRAMSPTGHVAAHHLEVVQSAQGIVEELPISRQRRLVGFTSNAANLSSIAEPVSHAVRDRQDLRLVTAHEAVVEYINTATPASVIVLGLPDVTEQYPGKINETAIVKAKGKIAEWMQTARTGSDEEILVSASELKNLIAKTAKLAMANERQLDGSEKGEFMRDPTVPIEGTVLVAGTELWKILEVAGWKEGLPDLENIDLIDPITLLMQHLAKLALRDPA
jgi:prolyl-tRNA editing enzyme YbaK/EbsC (Cys-tRNA(Pro) deacylase)